MAELMRQASEIRLQASPEKAPASGPGLPPRPGGAPGNPAMFLQAIAGSQMNLKDANLRDLGEKTEKKQDASQAQDLMSTLASALAARRAQIQAGDDDSDDGWSD